MKRVFRYDKKKNTLVTQSVIMIVIAAIMFYNYSYSKSLIFLVLMAFALAFVAIYFYRIFLMRVIFEEDKVIFKGLATQHTILKKEIYDVYILKQVGREVNKVKYIQGGDYSQVGSKSYILIRKNENIFQSNLSMFNAASEDYISLEYTPGIEKYLDILLEK